MIINDFYYKGKLYDNVDITFINKGIRMFGSLDKPKSYTEIGSFTRPHGTYESGCVGIYKTKKGKLRCSSYYDGCFHKIYHDIDIDMSNAELLAERVNGKIVRYGRLKELYG